MRVLGEKRVFETAYRMADGLEDLPWHRERLPPLLHAYLAHAPEGLAILDVGSGAGTMALELARRGHDVLGVDFVDEAVDLSRRRAEERGLDVEFVRADVLQWEAPRTFDIVLDCGLLHGLSDEDFPRYGDRLTDRLAEEGEYFLSHFVTRHPLDWRPVGPNRRERERIVELLPDDLELETYAYETVRPALPVGPTARFGHFWFHRTVPSPR